MHLTRGWFGPRLLKVQFTAGLFLLVSGTGYSEQLIAQEERLREPPLIPFNFTILEIAPIDFSKIRLMEDSAFLKPIEFEMVKREPLEIPQVEDAYARELRMREIRNERHCIITDCTWHLREKQYAIDHIKHLHNDNCYKAIRECLENVRSQLEAYVNGLVKGESANEKSGIETLIHRVMQYSPKLAASYNKLAPSDASLVINVGEEYAGHWLEYEKHHFIGLFLEVLGEHIELIEDCLGAAGCNLALSND